MATFFANFRDMRTCPYDKNHKVKSSKYLIHLNTCPKRGLAQVCPYNAEHRVMPDRMAKHLAECGTKLRDKFFYQLRPEPCLVPDVVTIKDEVDEEFRRGLEKFKIDIQNKAPSSMPPPPKKWTDNQRRRQRKDSLMSISEEPTEDDVPKVVYDQFYCSDDDQPQPQRTSRDQVIQRYRRKTEFEKQWNTEKATEPKTIMLLQHNSKDLVDQLVDRVKNGFGLDMMLYSQLDEGRREHLKKMMVQISRTRGEHNAEVERRRVQREQLEIIRKRKNLLLNQAKLRQYVAAQSASLSKSENGEDSGQTSVVSEPFDIEKALQQPETCHDYVIEDVPICTGLWKTVTPEMMNGDGEKPKIKSKIKIKSADLFVRQPRYYRRGNAFLPVQSLPKSRVY